jgi:outer membrane protein TolC
MLLLAAPAVAQERLTLAEALDAAAANNPEYRIARAQLETIPPLERPLWLSFVPRPGSLTFGTSYSQRRSFTAIDEFGRPARVDDPVIASSSGSSQGLAWGSITIFDGGARLASARSDRARAAGIRASAEAATVTLRVGLARLWYDAVRADAEIALHERMLATATETLEGTERLYAVGLRDPLDLLSAELRVAEREQALERARGALRSARLALGHEMGLGTPVEAELVDGFPDAFDPARLDLDDLVARAVTGSPTVASLGAAAESAAQGVGVARGQRWPSVSLGLSSSRGVSGRETEGLFQMNPRDESYGLSLSFRVPLFDQFQASEAITEARVARVAAEERLRAGRLEVESRVRGGVIALENAWREIALAERAAELSARRLELATRRYLLGDVAYPELSVAEDDAFSREIAVLAARHAFVTALLGLEETVGAPVR